MIWKVVLQKMMAMPKTIEENHSLGYKTYNKGCNTQNSNSELVN